MEKHGEEPPKEIEEAQEDLSPRAPRPYRVAILTWESAHSVIVGSVGAVVDALAAELASRGHEVHVYARMALNAKLPGHKLIGDVHYHFIEVQPLESDFVKECLNMCNAMVHFLLETERFMDAKFDIVHAFDWVTGQALINIKMNHERLCVFTMHSTQPGRRFGRTFGSLDVKMHGIEKDSVHYADRVIGTTGPLCDEINASFEFDTTKTRCVPLSVDCLQFDKPEKQTSQAKEELLKINASDRVVLFPAALDVSQGIQAALDAIPEVIAKHPTVRFVFAAAGSADQFIHRRTKELGVEGHVITTGSLGRPDLVSLYHCADVVLAPSTKSGFSLQVLYAWACKKPVLISTSGGMRDHVWHENEGLTVDGDGFGVAWGVNKILDDPGLGKYIGEQGRVKAAFSFAHKTMGVLTNDVYDELHGIFPPTAL